IPSAGGGPGPSARRPGRGPGDAGPYCRRVDRFFARSARVCAVRRTLWPRVESAPDAARAPRAVVPAPQRAADRATAGPPGRRVRRVEALRQTAVAPVRHRRVADARVAEHRDVHAGHADAARPVTRDGGCRGGGLPVRERGGRVSRRSGSRPGRRAPCHTHLARGLGAVPRRRADAVGVELRRRARDRRVSVAVNFAGQCDIRAGDCPHQRGYRILVDDGLCLGNGWAERAVRRHAGRPHRYRTRARHDGVHAAFRRPAGAAVADGETHAYRACPGECRGGPRLRARMLLSRGQIEQTGPMRRYPSTSDFAYSFGPGPLTPAIKALIAANVAGFLLAFIVPAVRLRLGLVPADVFEHFAVWQPVTYM